MKYRDIFGRLEYSLGPYFVPHRTGGCTGKYAILKKGPWYVTDAYIIIRGTRFEQVPLFDSWIQAVRFLKKHHTELI